MRIRTAERPPVIHTARLALRPFIAEDEDAMIGDVSDPQEVDRIYVEKILPKKMEYNLEYISRFGFRRDIRLMFSTVKNVIS